LSEACLLEQSIRKGSLKRDEELPDKVRIELGRSYLELGKHFIADFEPRPGPIKNRLSHSLSLLGLLA
ncbi:hypothetical protein LDC_3032, partial [sediment metagenome]